MEIATVYTSTFDKRKFLIWEIISAVLVSVLAVVFHYLYEWSGNNYLIGFISPINESVFEHIKILVFPFILISIIEYFIIKPDLKIFISSKIISTFVLIILLITVYYTYTGIIGEGIVLVDILSTFVYIFIAYLISYKLISSGHVFSNNTFIFLIAALIITIIAIFIFTYNPPNLPLFEDLSNKS